MLIEYSMFAKRVETSRYRVFRLDTKYRHTFNKRSVINPVEFSGFRYDPIRFIGIEPRFRIVNNGEVYDIKGDSGIDSRLLIY